jgi:hypothetical protein
LTVVAKSAKHKIFIIFEKTPFSYDNFISWEGIKDAVKEYVSDGASINAELFHLRPSIQGVFDSLNDKFQRKRHSIEIIAVIPDLAKGSWRVRVITQYSNGPKHLKTPRKVTFDKNLIVA